MAFEQENDPNEVKGHTRALFDLAIPSKVLLVWTHYYFDGSPRSLIDDAKEVALWCKGEGVPNLGRIWVVAGDWPKLALQLAEPQAKHERFLTCHPIPTSVEMLADDIAGFSSTWGFE